MVPQQKPPREGVGLGFLRMSAEHIRSLECSPTKNPADLRGLLNTVAALLGGRGVRHIKCHDVLHRSECIDIAEFLKILRRIASHIASGSLRLYGG